MRWMRYKLELIWYSIFNRLYDWRESIAQFAAELLKQCLLLNDGDMLVNKRHYRLFSTYELKKQKTENTKNKQSCIF